MGSEEEFVIKVRGLPWSTTGEEIMKFFENCKVKGDKNGIHIIMTREGRPSGEAFIEMDSEDDINEALKKDREYMGSRYMEVFKAKRIEMEWILMKSGNNMETALDDGCVRLRGLPFGCSKEEIAHFFTGLEIVPNGITLPMDGKGRSTGEAFVQFKNKDIAEKALLKHKDKIAHRYIEIFRSSLGEICQSVRRGNFSPFPQRPAPYDARDRFGGPNRFRPGGMNGMNGRGFRGGFNEDEDDMDEGPWPPQRNGFGLRGMGNFGGLGGGMGPGPGPRPSFGAGFGGGPAPFGGGPGTFGNNGGGLGMGGGGGGGGGGGNDVGPHCIHMRGLPFRATKQDVADFFRPVIPLSIDLTTDDKNRPSGEADVEFRTHDDAVMAMGKNKSHMDHRYIELFLNSTPGKGGSGFGGGGNFRNFANNMFKRF